MSELMVFWSWLWVVFPAAIALYLVVDMTRNFAMEKGTVWHRLLAAGHNSLTKFWARLLTVVTSSLLFVDQYAAVWGTPEMQNWARENLPSELVTTVALLLLIVTIWARNRTMRGRKLGL